MDLTLQHDESLKHNAKNSFYTEDELSLLYQLENNLVKTVSHEQVMENLRHHLGLVDNDEV